MPVRSDSPGVHICSLCPQHHMALVRALVPRPALLPPPSFSLLPATCRGLLSPWGPTACASHSTVGQHLPCLEPWPLLQGGSSLLRLTPWSGQPLHAPSLLSPTSHFLTNCLGPIFLKGSRTLVWRGVGGEVVQWGAVQVECTQQVTGLGAWLRVSRWACCLGSRVYTCPAILFSALCFLCSYSAKRR